MVIFKHLYGVVMSERIDEKLAVSKNSLGRQI